jgi:hypothetical protein
MWGIVSCGRDVADLNKDIDDEEQWHLILGLQNSLCSWWEWRRRFCFKDAYEYGPRKRRTLKEKNINLYNLPASGISLLPNYYKSLDLQGKL